MNTKPDRYTNESAQVYLVGGGIASLAAAAFFIRDGDIPGHNITILEESGKIGGSLDAAGDPVGARRGLFVASTEPHTATGIQRALRCVRSTQSVSGSP